MTLRVPEDLHHQLAEAATAEGRSLNAHLLYLLAAANAAPGEEVYRWAREARN
ncbi:toxin-antitoxin system HicB family antitoxin [Saccharopolyspora endophytica]|uniref:Toxin-antitoxin system HicB family antitoxin n=1 Tax=Saccharopolyspora endophytica TaxID=543886 RepID=A0ABS5DEN9_9PSEU|nr:toxin-antitoxin system HicB family antitoxin [Saccharopolyspora endophytica]MBQ0924759.1 toxin-antitoxin system HicB family antitoxin [Saccharopolyspora endophytica]